HRRRWTHFNNGPIVRKATTYWPGQHNQTGTLHTEHIMAEMKEKIFHILLSLLQIGIEPVPQVGTAQKGPQQCNIAVMPGIAAPCEKGIGSRSQGSDEQ